MPEWKEMRSVGNFEGIGDKLGIIKAGWCVGWHVNWNVGLFDGYACWL